MEEHNMEGHNHPTPRTYALVAFVLCVITLMEFGLFYVQSLKTIFVPLLLFLSAIKFYLVVSFYMHLKFDHPIFLRLLLIGLLVGAGIMLSLASLFFFAHPL